MDRTLKQFKTRVLAKPEVRKAYDQLADEFAFLDEVLKARTASGLTQAEVAALVGTTQSAIARLESPSGTHSPSVGTLQRYARALGCKVEIRLVPDAGLARRSSGRAKSAARRPT
jgi:transcriptional regulator with XRE-family HTH domain